MSKRESELLDRTPPHDLDAERAVLGAVMLKMSTLERLVGVLTAEDFYLDAHRRLYTHLEAVPCDNGEAVDMVVLVDWLRQAGDLEAIGGQAYLAELAHAACLPSSARYHGEKVHSHAVRRLVLHAAVGAVQGVFEPTTPLTDLLEGTRADLEAIAAQATVQGWPQWTCSELMKENIKLRYLIDGLLVEGQPCILAGPKKSLKTSLLLDMAVSLATGGYFLGHFAVPLRMTCGIMSGESGLAVIQETLQRICDAANKDPRAINNLIITDRIPSIDTAQDLTPLRRFIQANHLEVLILDPTYMAMSGEDAGNLFTQGAKLNRLNILCRDHGCTPILAHHTIKRPGGGQRDPLAPLELEDIAWAGFQENARQWYLVNRREWYEPGTGRHVIWFSVGGSAGHGGRWVVTIEEGTQATPGGRTWQTTVEESRDAIEAAASAKQSAKREADQQTTEAAQQTICNTMARIGHSESKTGIRELCDLSHPLFARAFARLTEQGSIIQDGTTRKGTRTVDAYSLPIEETPIEGSLW